MEFRSVLSYTGTMLEILGVLMLVPVLLSWFLGEKSYAGFFAGAVLSFSIGTLLDRRFRKGELDLSSAIGVAGLTFACVSFLGAFPYLGYLNPLDSLFESVSGFTTTGLTVAVPESLPLSVLFWRSMTQWIGGIGIIMIFILLSGSPGMSSHYLYKAEGFQDKLEASVRHAARKLFMIYGAYTLAGVVLLSAAGMSLFDAVNHALTGIATGGFSTHSLSVGYYQNVAVEAVMMLLMVLGATSFAVHGKLFGRRFKEYLSNPETRMFWPLLLVFSILVSLSLYGSGEAIRKGLFFSVSALTGSGFSTNPEVPGGFAFLLLIILMIVGGYAGSTAGGIKLIRFGILVKSIPWFARKMSLPQEAVVPLKLGSRVIKSHEIAIVTVFATMYFIMLAGSTFALMALGYPLSASFFQSASAGGTVGLSVLDVSGMHPAGKIVLMLDMLLGRLEIFPFLVLTYAAWSSLLGRFR